MRKRDDDAHTIELRWSRIVHRLAGTVGLMMDRAHYVVDGHAGTTDL
jgi:hypothetical protein